jgi:glutamine amidotransferase
MPRLAIIDYGSGNMRSAEKACERAAREGGISMEIEVTGDAARVLAADRVILPGVGAFADCMAGLSALPGMIEALEEVVTEMGRPFLGICVGMQLMASEGMEHGQTAGLGWIPGSVDKMRSQDPSLKIPHMGWNELIISQPEHPLWAGIASGDHAYFVHSYALRAKDPSHVVAEAGYGGPITAAVARDNLFGTQFHPEKSQAVGLRLLQNLLTWTP